MSESLQGGTSRRDMLKLASVAAVGGAGAAEAVSLGAASPAGAQEADVGVIHFFFNGSYTIQDTGAYAILGSPNYSNPSITGR